MYTIVLTTAAAAHTQPIAAPDVPTTEDDVHTLLDCVAAVPVCWKALVQGRMKCNIDVMFPDLRNRIDIGICLRDEGGVFVLAKTISFVCVYPVDIGEALGFYHVLQWVIDMHQTISILKLIPKAQRDAIYAGREDIYGLGNIITTS